MPDERLPKKIVYWELQVGKRSHCVRKVRYKDTLKASLKDFNIPTESWKQIARDHRIEQSGAIPKSYVYFLSNPHIQGGSRMISEVCVCVGVGRGRFDQITVLILRIRTGLRKV